MTAKQKKILRWILIIILFTGLWYTGHAAGIFNDLSAEKVQDHVRQAGSWGPLLFIVIFCIGELVHVPGMVFVAAGILAFGLNGGFVIGFIGALCSVCFSFLIIRFVGGKAIADIQRPIIQKLMDKLESRPITTVIVLRLVLWLAPPLNYALALSNISFINYTIGSAIGLVLPVVSFSIAFDVFLKYTSFL